MLAFCLGMFANAIFILNKLVLYKPPDLTNLGGTDSQTTIDSSGSRLLQTVDNSTVAVDSSTSD